MKVKAKGINAERELIHMFWNAGWAAVRVAGSGSSKYPSPDVVAGNNIRKLAIECKAIKGLNKYFPHKEIEELLIFAEKFGAEPWIGIRFDNINWYFTSAHDLEKTNNSFKLSLINAKKYGLLFEELIK